LKGTDIKAKSARGIMALGIGMFAGNGMKLVRRMILARLLAPSEIGLMAIVAGLSVAFEAFTEVGIKQSVIQNKNGADADYLNVALWMQVIRGLCLFLIAFFLAPWMSSFYNKPELLSLLRVCFLAILFRGLVCPRAFVLEKEYKFGRAVLLTQGSAILGVVITVVLAFIMRNVWALVIGFVSEMAILCVLSYIFVPFVPSLKIDKKSLSELMRFARGMFGLPILAMVSLQAPILVLGKVISDAQLGLYSYAALLAYFPVELFAKIIGPVLLPAFSEKQDDKIALRRGLLKATQMTVSLAIPLVVFMACYGNELLLLVYGPEFVVMAVPFAILCLNILARQVAAIIAGIYLGIGRPYLQRRFTIIRALAIVILIYPASLFYGPIGAAVVIVLSNFIALLIQLFVCRRVLDLEISSYVRSYLTGLILAVTVVAVFALLRLLGIKSVVLIMVAGSLSLLFSYGIYVGKLFFAKHD
jgi:O-antigen/teichoic acid export membrane protein